MADVDMADTGGIFRPIDALAGNAPGLEDDDVLDEDIDEDGGEGGDAPGLQPGGMYEHFRFVADKGQQLVRIDNFWCCAWSMPRAIVYRWLPMPGVYGSMDAPLSPITASNLWMLYR